MEIGEKVLLLCARVDEWGVDDDQSQPAIDSHTFSWLRATVMSQEGEEVQLRLEDGAIAYYDRRFVLTMDEAKRVATPKVE